MSTTLDIAIIGYGCAGQALAILLAREGHRVQVYEQAEQPGPVGAGFLLQPVGQAVLWELGLLDGVLAHGARIRGLHGENPGGRTVLSMQYADLDPRLFGLGLQRGALFELLAAARPPEVALHAGRRIVRVDATRGLVTDALDRSEGPFDLVIAADGAASVLRGLLPRVPLDRPYPWGALWCLLPQRDWPWAAELRQRYRLARQMVGLLPVGTRPGDATPQLSFFWSLPTAAFAEWPAQPAESWYQELLALWPALAPVLPALRGAATSLRRASYRYVRLPRCWHQGRLVLAGDAAHAMSPQLGQGVNMALLDALALRDALRHTGTWDQRLRAYAARRRNHLKAYQLWSRWLTPVFQSDRDWLARLRDACLHPLGRLPGGRSQMLRILTGTRRGWLFGRWPLAEGFLAALGHAADTR